MRHLLVSSFLPLLLLLAVVRCEENTFSAEGDGDVATRALRDAQGGGGYHGGGGGGGGYHGGGGGGGGWWPYPQPQYPYPQYPYPQYPYPQYPYPQYPYPQYPPYPQPDPYWKSCKNPIDKTCPRCTDLKPDSPKVCRDFCINNKHCFCLPY